LVLTIDSYGKVHNLDSSINDLVLKLDPNDGFWHSLWHSFIGILGFAEEPSDSFKKPLNYDCVLYNCSNDSHKQLKSNTTVYSALEILFQIIIYLDKLLNNSTEVKTDETEASKLFLAPLYKVHMKKEHSTCVQTVTVIMLILYQLVMQVVVVNL
jgi:hypothetical protein